MKLSEHWLRQWVDPSLKTAELAHQMTMTGLEVDTVTAVAGQFSKVVVGEVLSTKPHPDAKKLTCCEVNVGDKKPLHIVCGAANVRVGLKVPVALVGAVLPGDFKIKAAKLRGETSEGMICAASELGLQHWQGSEAGIMELPLDAPVGQDFRKYFFADDHVIDIEITPNRGDCLSVHGIARDVAVMNQSTLKTVSLKPVSASISDKLKITLSAKADCPRYVGRIIRSVDNTVVTPSWIQLFLQRSGIRPINPVVDVCNYVMLELGQPMHGFDLSKLQGGITVRCAKKDESLLLLDGNEITLTADDLVIADDKKALALAGIMGGLDSGIVNETTDVFLESAFFAPTAISLGARHQNMGSDSSYRFERGVDFNLQVDAIERATALLLEITGGKPAEVFEAVAKKELPKRDPILLRRDQIQRVLGITLPDKQVLKILQDLGMTVKASNVGWEVTAPSYRFDIVLEIDLIEELVRVFGYDKISPEQMTATLQMPYYSEQYLSDLRVRQLLIDRGYHECITYSFIDPVLQKMFVPAGESMQLQNPISAEMSVMRATLWPGLLQTLQLNLRHQCDRMRLFEIGLCFEYLGRGSELSQTPKLAMIMTGSAHPEQWGLKKQPTDFYDLKADLMAFLSETGTYTWKKESHTALHPGRSAALYRGDQCLGWLGELHPAVLDQLGVHQPVMACEVLLEAVQAINIPTFKPFSRFPAMRRDLAIVLDEVVTAATLREMIVSAAGEQLQSVQIFDVYQGKGIENGKKSIALGLTFQDPSRTLRDEEINEIIHGVVNVLERELNATLRA